MALNLSRIFRGKSPAEGVVTDNVDPDELGARQPAPIVIEDHVDMIGGPGPGVVMKDGNNNVTLENFRNDPGADGVKWDGPDIDANKNEILYNGHAGLGASNATERASVEYPNAAGPRQHSVFDDTDGSESAVPDEQHEDAQVENEDANAVDDADTLTDVGFSNDIGGQARFGKAPGFDEADALFGRTARQSVSPGLNNGFDQEGTSAGASQYNPKEIGIDKVRGEGLIDSIDFPKVTQAGSLNALPEVGDEVLVQFSKDGGQPTGIHDIHMNQGNSYTATDDLWKFKSDSQGDAGNEAARTAGPGQQDQGFMMQDGELYPRGLRDMEIQMAKGEDAIIQKFEEFPQSLASAGNLGPVEPPAANAVEYGLITAFRGGEAQDGAAGNETARTAGSGSHAERVDQYIPKIQGDDVPSVHLGSSEGSQGSGGFLSQLNPGRPEAQGWYVPELDSDSSAMVVGGHPTGIPGEPSAVMQDYYAHSNLTPNGDEDKLGNFEIQRLNDAGAESEHFRLDLEGQMAGYLRTNDGAGDEAARTTGPGQQGQGFMMQDGELYPRGLLHDIGTGDGLVENQVLSASAFSSQTQPHADGLVSESSASGQGQGFITETPLDNDSYTATDDLWKFRGDANAPTSTGDQPELQVRPGDIVGRLPGADGYALDLGVDTGITDQTARTAGPGAAGFRPSPVGDGTTEQFSAGQDARIDPQFQAMPELDASGNSVVDAADYTVWRDNLRASNPPEGVLPFIEQNNLAGGGRFTGSEDQIKTLMENLREKGLIDTSTGEIVWATGGDSRSDGISESGDMVNWLRSNQPPSPQGESNFTAPGDVAGMKLHESRDSLAELGEEQQVISPAAGETERSMGPGSQGFFRPNPAGDGTTEHFFRPNPAGDGTTDAMKNELAIESFDFREGTPPEGMAARVVDFREGGVNDTTHQFIDDDGPSTFLDALGDNASPEPQESMTLNFEEIKIHHADPAHHADLDVDFDGLDSDVDVP